MNKLFKNFKEFKSKILDNLPDGGLAKETELLKKTLKLVDPDGVKIGSVDILIKQRDLTSQATFTNDYRSITIGSTKKTQDLDDIHIYNILSISGEIKTLGCAGQIDSTIREEFEPTIGLTTLLKIREKYHLNDMHPGTREQEEYFKKKGWNINNGRDKIKEDPMYIDNDYTYGSARLVAPLPEFIIETLEMISSPLLLTPKKNDDGKDS